MFDDHIGPITSRVAECWRNREVEAAAALAEKVAELRDVLVAELAATEAECSEAAGDGACGERERRRLEHFTVAHAAFAL